MKEVSCAICVYDLPTCLCAAFEATAPRTWPQEKRNIFYIRGIEAFFVRMPPDVISYIRGIETFLFGCPQM
jgi:hypothetical protein